MRPALIAVLACLIVPAISQARLDISVTPKEPSVRDAIRVSFKAPRKLRTGVHYEAVVSHVGKLGAGICSANVHKTTERNPSKGKTVTIRIKPQDYKIAPSGKWCLGTSDVVVSTQRDGEIEILKSLGRTRIRFHRSR